MIIELGRGDAQRSVGFQMWGTSLRLRGQRTLPRGGILEPSLEEEEGLSRWGKRGREGVFH